MAKATSKRTVYERHDVDHSTGEVVKSVQVTRTTQEVEMFGKIFLSAFDKLAKLTAGELQVFMAILSSLRYEGKNIFYSDQDAREQLCKDWNLSEGFFKNTLGKLVKLGFVNKLGKAKFEVSPFIFWAGSEKSRK